MRQMMGVVLALALASSACAGKRAPIYFGLGAGSMKLANTNNLTGNTGTVNAGYALVGLELAPWLAGEVRVGTSETSDRFGSVTFPSFSVFSFDQTVNTHTIMDAGAFSSVLLKAHVTATDRVRLYALAGGTNLRFDSVAEQRSFFGPFPSVTVAASGGRKFALSTGIGVEGDISKRWSLRGEYLRLWDSVELDTFNATGLSSASVSMYSAGVTCRL